MKTLYLSGEIGWEIRSDMVKDFLIPGSSEAVRVFVNSPGGFLDEAFAMYNLFKQYKGNVEFVISGFAASAMSYLIMSGDKISAFKNSIFMAHKSWGFIAGNADELAAEVEILNGFDGIMAEAYTERLGGTKDEILQKMKDELWLVGWEPLTDAGIIDNVIDKPSELEIDSNILDLINKDVSSPANKAEARARIIQTHNKMKKDDERNQSNMKQVALIVGENSKEFNQNNNSVKNKPKGEKTMDLQEFLKSNPEALAEYNKNLQAAMDEGQLKAKATIENANDHERIAKILTIAGVDLTPELAKALDGTTSSEDFAIEELTKAKGLQADAAKDQGSFGALASKQTPGDQAKTVLETDASDIEAYEKKAEEKAKASMKSGGK